MSIQTKISVEVTEEIRSLAKLPPDEVCVSRTGFTLYQLLNLIANINRDFPFKSRSRIRTYKYLVAKRKPTELGGNPKRIAINEILFLLERRLVNQNNFPNILSAADQNSVANNQIELNNWIVDNNIPTNLESNLVELGRELFLELEDLDWRQTQRKSKGRSKCPKRSTFDHIKPDALSRQDHKKLIIKQYEMFDLPLANSLKENIYALSECESTINRFLEQLKLYLCACNQWLELPVVPDRHLERSDDDQDSERQVRAARLVKDCQKYFELLTAKHPEFKQKRSKGRSRIVSEFGDMCRILANTLGDSRFANSTVRSILGNHKYQCRFWLNDQFYDQIRKNCIFKGYPYFSNDPRNERLFREKCLNDVKETLRNQGQLCPPQKELEIQLYSVIRSVQQTYTYLNTLGRNTS